MHIVALFGIVLLIILRIVGLLVSIEFKLEFKGNKYLILIIGWSFWIIAGITALSVGFIEIPFFNDLVLLMNGISSTLAMLFILIGLHSYFRKIKVKSLIALSTIFTMIPLIAFFLGFYPISLNISFIFLFFVILFYTFLPFGRLEVFRTKLTFKSLFWYLILVIAISMMVISYVISVFQGYSYGFYSNDFSIAMFINYFLGNISTLVILVYYIHLEYDISKIQKYELRDRYSHDLGNIIQVIYSATDLTKDSDDLNKDNSENLELIQKKCEEAAKLIKDIKDTQ
ncbi:MAG: hypothetical protein EAX91_08925 [Candidatus Lokiarchaeota archaeon]|nr:hypothetical protein [Candidatus Lokiarchaeota archaeon]